MSENRFRQRLVLCAVLLLAAVSGLGFRLAFLHLGPTEALREGINRSRSYRKAIEMERGKIYDRHGKDNILALDLSRYNVCADPPLVRGGGNLVQTACTLAEILDLPVDEVAVNLSREDTHYVRLSRFVDSDCVARIQAAKPTGIYFEETTVRYYPQRSLMCHVLGFVNYERVGSSGIEQAMERFMKGSPGFLESEKDGLRREMPSKRQRVVPALQGADVYLTLDQNLQYMVEKAIDDVLLEQQAVAGWAIVQRVRTGEILAMVARPAFDLNAFPETAESQRLNRAIGCVYEPGSTMKAVTFAAALNEGLVTPETVFDCENGTWYHAGKPLRDFHPYGKLNVADGLKKSSNIMSAKIAVMLGDKRLHRYLRSFGLGQVMGIDLPGEEQGILHPVSAWSAISSSRIAIGQGVAVTALQLLGVYCAIANDGKVMRPYVVNRVVARDGSILLQRQPEMVGRAVSEETAATMRELLSRVTEADGTGRRAAVEGYRVAGKTGTAQKPVDGGYSSTAHYASFVGFLPAEDPEIGVIVVVDEPRKAHTGGVVAGPAFREIASQAVRYLDIPCAQREAVAKR